MYLNKNGTSILSSSTPTSQGKVANQLGSQGQCVIIILTIPTMDFGQIKLPKHLQKYSTLYVENCDI